MSTVLRIGFMPLVDAAPLVVAARKGFAGAEGLVLDLQRQTSWATLRDKVAACRLDAAQMLAPMPIAAALDLPQGGPRLIAPMALGFNGNAVTVCNRLWDAMVAEGAEDTGDPVVNGAALARVVRARPPGSEPLALAVVFPFSAHRYELLDWLAGAGLDPERELRAPVVPPPFMLDALEAGFIDGFCVGEPWNTAAILGGHGRLVTTKAALKGRGPEKVLAMRADWADAHETSMLALVRAIVAAARWCDAPENRDELVGLLCSPDALDAAPDHVRPVLAGELPLDAARRLAVSEAILFHAGGATVPSPAHAEWFYRQMVRWGDVAESGAGLASARDCFRADLYARALG